MAALTAAVDDAMAGRGRLVLLAGEPGIGKTCSAEKLADYGRDCGALILWGRCYEGDGAPAFWPWVEILRGAVRSLDEAALAEAVNGDGPLLAVLLPELSPERAPATVATESPESRFRLFAAVARLLEQVGSTTPLLIVLDDLQGADRSSLLLLELIVRGLRQSPILVVGTYRDAGGGGIDNALDQSVAELLREPGTVRVRLRGLSEADVGRLVEQRLQRTPPPGLTALIHERTDGNPLFVRELLDAFAAEGGATEDALRRLHLTVPNTVRAVMTRRLARLSPVCRATLDVAAVIGREFDLPLLIAVLNDIGEGPNGVGRPDDGVSPAVFEEVEFAGIAAPISESRRRYRFAHALIRDVLCEAVGAAREAELHERVGAALERFPDRDAHLAELAHHFLEAARLARGAEVGGVHDKAVAYARQAGDRARAVLAYEESARWYRRALDLMSLSSGADEGRRCAVLVDLGIALRDAGDLEASKALLLRAVELAKRLQLPEELSRAALHFGTKVVWGEQFAPDHTLLPLLESATAAWGEHENCAHALVLARLALALRFSPNEERRLYTGRRALQMARRLGDSAVIIEASHAWMATHWRADNLDERLALSAEMVARAEQLHEGGFAVLANSWRHKLLMEAGEFPAAEVVQGRWQRLALQSRETLYRWWVQGAHVALAISQGRFAEAESLAQDALLLEQRVSGGPPLQHLIQMVGLWSSQGRRAPLEMVLATQANGAFPGFTQQCSIANIARELGRDAEARAMFERLAAREFADLPQDETWLTCLHYLAEVCAFVGDIARAERLMELLDPYENRATINPGSGVYLAPVAYDLALLETALGLWDDAARHFVRAQEMNQSFGARPAMARTQYAQARMLLARDGTDQGGGVSELLAGAQAAASALDMPLLLERVQEMQRQLDASNVGPAAVVPIDQPFARARLFRRDGDYWSIGDPDALVRLKNSKGLQYLWFLLSHPGEEFLALDLVARTRSGGDSDEPAAPIRDAALIILDASSKTAYRQRLAELRETLEEAEGANDRGIAERARTEIQFIEDELVAAIGLGGRDRTSSSNAERARSTVTKGIKATVAKIAAANPGLGRHLDHTVRTGVFCAYLPDPDDRTNWQF